MALGKFEGDKGGRGVSIKFSPDGRVIATTSEYGVSQLWQKDGTLLLTLEPDVFPVAFSSDSQTIATTNDRDTVEVRQLDGTPVHTSVGNRIRFDPTSGLIATVKSQRNDRSARMLGHAMAPPDLNSVVSLFDEQRSLIYNFAGDDIQFSEDGKTIVIFTKDSSGTGESLELFKTVRVIPWTVEGLTDHACQQIDDFLERSPYVADSDKLLCD